MRYVTTRNSSVFYQAQQVLTENVAPDGGLFIPVSLPQVDSRQLRDFLDAGCCEAIAQILNLFFNANLNAWDIQVCIGRYPIKITNPGRKTLIADVWGNPGGSYEYAVSSLNDRLLQSTGTTAQSWTRIAIGVAFAFGMYAEMHKTGMHEHGGSFDVCVLDGDLSQPLAMLYARKMGLPIGRIIICSKENGVIWDLVNHGQLNLHQISSAQKLAMQRLLCCILDTDHVTEYISACETRSVYNILPEQKDLFSSYLFAAVISDERTGAITENIGVPVTTDTATCYAGLQDYRAKTGQGRQTLLVSYTAPN